MYKILLVLLAVAAGAEAIRPSRLSGLKAMVKSTELGCQQECDDCVQSFGQVQQVLKDKKNVDDLHRQVDQLCSYLAWMGADKSCRQALNKNLDQVIDYILQHTPKQICQSINMCKGGELEGQTSMPGLTDIVSLIELSNGLGDERCDQCMQFAEKLQETLKDPKNVDDLLEQAAAMCDYLKFIGLDAPCKAGLYKNADQFVKYILNNKPQQICQAVQMC